MWGLRPPVEFAGGLLPGEWWPRAAAPSWWQRFPELWRIRRDIEVAGIAGARAAAALRVRGAAAAIAGTGRVEETFLVLLEFGF